MPTRYALHADWPGLDNRQIINYFKKVAALSASPGNVSGGGKMPRCAVFNFPIRPRLMGFASKSGLSDPLPPTAAVPLCKGDNKTNNINDCILPLRKGRAAVGGRGSISWTFEAKPFFAQHEVA